MGPVVAKVTQKSDTAKARWLPPKQQRGKADLPMFAATTSVPCPDSFHTPSAGLQVTVRRLCRMEFPEF